VDQEQLHAFVRGSSGRSFQAPQATPSAYPTPAPLGRKKVSLMRGGNLRTNCLGNPPSFNQLSFPLLKDMDQASHAVRLVDRGQFKYIRQVSRAIDVARSTIQDRRALRQPRGQEEVLAKYIQNTQLQYAPVNREQLHVVAEMLAQLNEPNARLGKNWLSPGSSIDTQI
jgi:hypothetical protein